MNSQTYWSNGVLREITDGVLRREIPKSSGVARHWHPNGILAKEMNMVNGVGDGVVREWHDNGQLAHEWTYKMGEIDGIVRQWSREGKLLGEYEMKMGWGISRKWNEEGILVSVLEKISDKGYRGTIWDDHGRSRESFLWNGKSISKKKFYEKLVLIRSK